MLSSELERIWNAMCVKYKEVTAIIYAIVIIIALVALTIITW